MWADYYLRPNGEVVIVGEDFDHPDMDSVHSDWKRVLPVLAFRLRCLTTQLSRRLTRARRFVSPRSDTR
jgi:hypothetical protein